MVEAMNANNAYGNIQRMGVGADKRVIYKVIDSNGQEAGKMSVNYADVDRFEKSYRDIMSVAPQIQQYAAEHSSPEDIKSRRNKSRFIIGAGGFIGASLPFIFMKKSGTVKKVLTSIAGIVAGLTAGFAASIRVTSPPGALKFAKATRDLSKVDIRPVVEENGQSLNKQI